MNKKEIKKILKSWIDNGYLMDRRDIPEKERKIGEEEYMKSNKILMDLGFVEMIPGNDYYELKGNCPSWIRDFCLDNE